MASPLVFSVTRREPVLVPPAKTTPHEFKPLSDIDDQEGLRFQIRSIHFYRNNIAMKGRDPVRVLKDAMAKALVFYYPLAGRLREGPGRKIIVECNGEGIMFIEADADVRLEQFGESLKPPFPCYDELLYDVPGSGGIFHCPLLLMQVTRLRCGGFIFAARMNHTIADGYGFHNFLIAMVEMIKGSAAPSVIPVWSRELLRARDPPRVTHLHREYDDVADTKGTIIPLVDMAQRSFFFGKREFSALRKHVPPHLRTCSTFELLTACLWRCRTTALSPDPDEEVRAVCIVNTRFKYKPPLPAGYYGNALAFPVAISTAEKLCEKPLGYALELVKKAKEEVSQEYVESVADLLVLRGRPHFAVVNAYLVSDLTHAGLERVDFGWGRPLYGSVPNAGVGNIEGVASFYIPFRNVEGEDGILVPLCLPGPAMERFVVELEAFINEEPYNRTPKVIMSGL
ncbi:benzyl alcohol O-benzoyltransferase-like [Tasmannia lanceolata]|uniref:benzyl alcohol O-benzoyltransferase-like n=1 Tax=Tasmannia lanceolata TaxID=3420 RepID=UPI004062B9C5